ncbi:hypothetical protein Van01_51720 [Micromonospora andamanensis]|uniref:Uncharacterized protein n=1 Tax=Micromonospora andamanensis TaxID=1287068 RepID=A0ABQ4I229_9ACTN|nr:hypothetical protein Van01_51720 [Micromonospora andamanensis]
MTLRLDEGDEPVQAGTVYGCCVDHRVDRLGQTVDATARAVDEDALTEPLPDSGRGCLARR